jgi:release factor glutamine methyltransferase
MTLRGCLGRGEAQLRSGPHHGRARRDAETLLLHLIGKDRAWLMAHDDEEFGGCKAIQYAALLDRRYQGEPIQYITGEAEFFGLPMRVTPDVLIPRPETEHLVEKALSLAQSFSAPRIADLGTGSGAIAIALAHALPHANLTATDISAAALAIAKANAERNGVAGRIHFMQADLLKPLEPLAGNVDAPAHFDIIVSNPPYIPATDRPSLSVEVRDYEPALALFAGDDGLAICRRLIPVAFAALSTNGRLALEIGFGQADPIASLLANAGFRNIAFTPDLQGIPRVASAQRGS